MVTQPSWTDVEATANLSIHLLRAAESALNAEDSEIRINAVAEGRALTKAEFRKLQRLSGCRQEVLQAMKDVAMAAAIAIDASPEAHRAVAAYKKINKGLKATRKRLKTIQTAFENLKKAAELIDKAVDMAGKVL
jgi:hypothetical protein